MSLVVLEGLIWLKHQNQLAPVILHLTRLTISFLIISLIWFGWERQHIPPTGLDETYLVLTAICLVIFLNIKTKFRASPGFFSLSLLLTSALWGLGIYRVWQETPSFGPGPLWAWGLLGRWLILIGVAQLYWLTLISTFAWLQKQIKRPAFQTIEFFDPEPAVCLIKDQQATSLLIILPGSFLFIVRAWWGWGTAISQNLALIIVILLLLAAWWLRFTRPQRRLWTLTLTFFALLMALPALDVIAC